MKMNLYETGKLIGSVTLGEDGTPHFTGEKADVVRRVWRQLGDFFHLQANHRDLMRVMPMYLHGRLSAEAVDYEVMSRSEYDDLREQIDMVHA